MREAAGVRIIRRHPFPGCHVYIGEAQGIRVKLKTCCDAYIQRQARASDLEPEQQVNFPGGRAVLGRAVHINQLSVHQLVAMAGIRRHRLKFGNRDFARFGNHCEAPLWGLGAGPTLKSVQHGENIGHRAGKARYFRSSGQYIANAENLLQAGRGDGY